MIQCNESYENLLNFCKLSFTKISKLFWFFLIFSFFSKCWKNRTRNFQQFFCRKIKTFNFFEKISDFLKKFLIFFLKNHLYYTYRVVSSQKIVTADLLARRRWRSPPIQTSNARLWLANSPKTKDLG